jgi:hypothetical protein
MTINNPATPVAPATVTPGQDANVVITPSTPAQPAVPEGKVTIDTKEYAQLQRDAARARSAQKRDEINRRKNVAIPDGADNDTIKAIEEANNRAAEAEQKALQSEVRSSVRDILEKEEFKSIPKSTKELIMKNPSALSKASSLEEALLDIEDFLRDNVLGVDSVTVPMPAAPAAGGKNETPPVINSGAPAPSDSAGLEDVSKLSGPSRSQAMIRNKMREARGVKAV